MKKRFRGSYKSLNRTSEQLGKSIEYYFTLFPYSFPYFPSYGYIYNKTPYESRILGMLFFYSIYIFGGLSFLFIEDFLSNMFGYFLLFYLIAGGFLSYMICYALLYLKIFRKLLEKTCKP